MWLQHIKDSNMKKISVNDYWVGKFNVWLNMSMKIPTQHLTQHSLPNISLIQIHLLWSTSFSSIFRNKKNCRHMFKIKVICTCVFTVADGILCTSSFKRFVAYNSENITSWKSSQKMLVKKDAMTKKFSVSTNCTEIFSLWDTKMFLNSDDLKW